MGNGGTMPSTELTPAILTWMKLYPQRTTQDILHVLLNCLQRTQKFRFIMYLSTNSKTKLVSKDQKRAELQPLHPSQMATYEIACEWQPCPLQHAGPSGFTQAILKCCLTLTTDTHSLKGHPALKTKKEDLFPWGGKWTFSSTTERNYLTAVTHTWHTHREPPYLSANLTMPEVLDLHHPKDPIFHVHKEIY